LIEAIQNLSTKDNEYLVPRKQTKSIVSLNNGNAGHDFDAFYQRKFEMFANVENSITMMKLSESCELYDHMA